MAENDFITFFRDEPSCRKSDVDFHGWFNYAQSVDHSLKMGFVDFAHRIFTPDFYNYVGDPTDKVCCEIGFGGGRLLLPASCFFGHAHGIDIHNEFSRVATHLNNNGRTNFTLHTQAEAIGESIVSNSVDFYFSFITFQHFPNWNTAREYIKLIERTLKPGGCGVIYLGHNTMNHDDVNIVEPKTYSDFPMTMYVKPTYAKHEFESCGLKVTEVENSTKYPWNNSPGRQFYIKFHK